MARVDSPALQTRDTTYIDLSRLLSRLEHTLLSPGPDPELRTSSVRRTKVGANVEHARTLLLRLEHESAANKSGAQKAAAQTDLQQKRAVLKQLQNRLYELNQLDDGDEPGEPDADDESGEDSDTEDLINRYAPALKHTSNSIDTDRGSGTPFLPQGQAAAAAAAATISSTLRSRGAAAPTANTAMTTGSSSTAAASNIPKPGASTTPFAPKATSVPADSANETLLSHHSSEQEALTTSLLTLATALKNSTKNFSDTLTGSNPVVDRATAALDKSAQGMETAGKKMGTLRRMTEGRGWLGRMSLYAWVAAGWVLALVVVFVLPKLRF